MTNQKHFKAQVRQQLRQKQHLSQTLGDHVGAALQAVAAIREEILPKHLVVQLAPSVHLVVNVMRQRQSKAAKVCQGCGKTDEDIALLSRRVVIFVDSSCRYLVWPCSGRVCLNNSFHA